MTKLVSGKVTYVHRALWPEVIAIGCAKESWQTAPLSEDARKLLAAVEREPVLPDGGSNKAASGLETKLLVYSEQFHTESGAHLRRLESWAHWSGRTGFGGTAVSVAEARRKLEEVLAALNEKYRGVGRLPWQAGRAASKGR